MADRFRLQQKFWLDVNKPEEFALTDTIASLKEERVFSQVVRDGIRLMAALRVGDTGVLEELFPWVTQEAFQFGVESASESNGNELEEKIDQLTQLVQGLHEAPPPLPPKGTLHRAAHISSVSDGEVDIEIRQASRDENDKPSWNNHISMALLLGNFDHLSPEIIEYGVRIGRIPKEVNMVRVDKGQISIDLGNARVMDSPKIEAVIFEDKSLLELIL